MFLVIQYLGTTAMGLLQLHVEKQTMELFETICTVSPLWLVLVCLLPFRLLPSLNHVQWSHGCFQPISAGPSFFARYINCGC
jgi:hypothetical protein